MSKIAGILTCELSLTDEEKVSLEELRNALQEDLNPETQLEQIDFEYILWCELRRIRASNEESRWADSSGAKNASPSAAAAPAENNTPSKWASKADLTSATALLAATRDDINDDGWIHAEEWKEPMIKAFGERFYQSLVQWRPMSSLDDILLAEALCAKGKLYGMGLPTPLQTHLDLEKKRVVVDPRLCQQMAVKLIEEKIRHLEEMKRVEGLTHDASGDRQRGRSLRAAARATAEAARELERALESYRRLKNRA